MPEETFFPRMIVDAHVPDKVSGKDDFVHLAKRTLKQMLPDFFDFSALPTVQEFTVLKKRFREEIPFVTHFLGETAPSHASFFFLSPFRSNAFQFFLEMITNWLIPGKRLNTAFFYGVDLLLPDYGNEQYMLGQIVVRLESVHEIIEIRKNLSVIEAEIRLGVSSAYYARRILEVKGFSADQKTALIQEHIAYVVKRLPQEFDFDVFSEMQHILVKCPDHFKRGRKSRHLSRIISINYLFRKNLQEAEKNASHKRHVLVKLFKERVQEDGGEQRVLGIVVGVHFLDEKEVLEDRHILKAIKNYIPDAHILEGSYFLHRKGIENLCTFYLEIKKNDGSDFSGEEMNRLRKELAGDLKGRVEHLMHPIFMPRNEEEILRNALSLASQLRFLKDPPQVFISFDEQTHSRLFFTVILVRVIKLPSLPIQDIFLKADTFLEYIPDWCRNVGHLRRRYPKEATVFRIALPKEMFLRGDHSIDLYKARQIVYSELERVLGPLRDFNGGMISKQSETFNRMREILTAECWNVNDLLLENFFYSLTPAEMRGVMDPNALRTLFIMLMDILETRHHGVDSPYSISVRRELDSVYIILASEDKGLRKKIDRDLSRFNIPLSELVTISLNPQDQYCLGYIYLCDDHYKQDHFCRTIEHAIEMRYSSTLASPKK